MYPTLFITPGVKQFAEDVDTERQAQLTKWGDQQHPDGTGLPVYQHSARRYRDHANRAAESGHLAWRDILLEEAHEALAEKDPVPLRTELVQVAAVCAAWISDLDRRGEQPAAEEQQAQATPQPDREQEIRARAEAATPGPWGSYDGETYADVAADLMMTGSSSYSYRQKIARLEDEDFWDDPAHQDADDDEAAAQMAANAVFIAHAREDIPWLLARVAELEADRDAFRDQRNAVFATNEHLLAQVQESDGARLRAENEARTMFRADRDAAVAAAVRRAWVDAADFLRDAHFRDGLSVQEIGTAMRHQAAAVSPAREQREAQQADPAAADNPTPLRWGLGDVLHGDDDTVAICLSGPGREPYWLELDPERAAALRDDLTASEEQGEDAAPELTPTDRQFLSFALDEAADEMSLRDGFTDADRAALDKLRHLADEPETRP